MPRKCCVTGCKSNYASSSTGCANICVSGRYSKATRMNKQNTSRKRFVIKEDVFTDRECRHFCTLFLHATVISCRPI